MIIKYPKISNENLFHKIENICINENIKYDTTSINTLLFISDYDIRQAINNLECIFYSYGVINTENIYKLIDKPKPYYITEILKYCYSNDYGNTCY